jgi:hypothetical protein
MPEAEQQASRMREGLAPVPHTREVIAQELPVVRRRLVERAQALTGKGRELIARARNVLSQVTHQLHLPSLPGKRIA